MGRISREDGLKNHPQVFRFFTAFGLLSVGAVIGFMFATLMNSRQSDPASIFSSNKAWKGPIVGKWEGIDHIPPDPLKGSGESRTRCERHGSLPSPPIRLRDRFLEPRVRSEGPGPPRRHRG